MTLYPTHSKLETCKEYDGLFKHINIPPNHLHPPNHTKNSRARSFLILTALTTPLHPTMPTKAIIINYEQWVQIELAYLVSLNY